MWWIWHFPISVRIMLSQLREPQMQIGRIRFKFWVFHIKWSANKKSEALFRLELRRRETDISLMSFHIQLFKDMDYLYHFTVSQVAIEPSPTSLSYRCFSSRTKCVLCLCVWAWRLSQSVLLWAYISESGSLAAWEVLRAVIICSAVSIN